MKALKKILFALPLLALACGAQTATTPTLGYATVPDINGTGTTVPLSTSHVYCLSVQITAMPTNGSLVRFGGPATSISQGTVIAPGGGQFETFMINRMLDLSAMYVYVASGDKVAATCKQ